MSFHMQLVSTMDGRPAGVIVMSRDASWAPPAAAENTSATC